MSEDEAQVDEPDFSGWTMERMDSDALRQLARDVHQGLVYFGQKDDDIGMVFMPLALGGLRNAPREEIEKIGAVYEYLSEAAPRSINGRPSFFSCRFLHQEDLAQLLKLVAAIESAVEGALDTSE